MDGSLARREDCVERLRELTIDSLFLSRYALLIAQEHLHIDKLNHLVDAVDEFSNSPDIRPIVRVEKLNAERWKRSRLS